MPTTCKLTEVSVAEFTKRIKRRRAMQYGVPQVYAVNPGGAIMLDPRPAKGIIKSIHIVINDERTLEERAALPETED